MVKVFDVDSEKLINRMKEELKKVEQIKPAEWSKFVKTSVIKSRPPQEDDFWYKRAAAILRQLYKMGKPIGVQRLRTKYGGKQQNKPKPAHFKRASGNVIRKIIQQIERAGFIKQVTISGRKGRVLTPKGKSFVDKQAALIAKEQKNE
jgi:small subunit ribosomal protein S19e